MLRINRLTAAAFCASMAAISSGCCNFCLPFPAIVWKPIGVGLPGTRSAAIPDTYPVGSVVRAHFHAMQTNAEASDFIVHRNDFVGETTQMTNDGADRLFEIAARMRSAPFPVLVERSDNNSNPQLDAERRTAIAMYLADLGNPDADQRTIVAPSYSRAISSTEGELDYYRFVNSRGGFGGVNNGTNGSNVGGFGGFGAGGFGR